MKKNLITLIAISCMLLIIAGEALAVSPNITANGSDGTVTVNTGGTLTVAVSLNAEDSAGQDADWWVAADTPFGWFYLDASTFGWVFVGTSRAGLRVTHQGPLVDLRLIEVLNMSIPEGTYTFYLAVDTIKNGLLDFDSLYYDSVVVKIIPIPTDVKIYINPGDPLLVSVKTSAGDFVEYFGEKDSNGLATALDAITVTSADGDITNILLDDQLRPTRMLKPNGDSFEIVWESDTLIHLSAILEDGSIRVNESFDLSTLTSSSAESLPPKSIGLDGLSNTDDRGGIPAELIVPPSFSMDQNITVAPDVSQLLVNVTNCGLPVFDAFVEVAVIPFSYAGNPEEGFNVTARYLGGGKYVANIPVTTSSELTLLPSFICNSFADELARVCDFRQTLSDTKAAELCIMYAAFAGATTTPAGGLTVFAACGSSMAASSIYCAGAERFDPRKFEARICETVSDVIDRVKGVASYRFYPTVIIAGKGTFGTEVTDKLPSSGPFPAMFIDADALCTPNWENGCNIESTGGATYEGFLRDLPPYSGKNLFCSDRDDVTWFLGNRVLSIKREGAPDLNGCYPNSTLTTTYRTYVGKICPP